MLDTSVGSTRPQNRPAHDAVARLVRDLKNLKPIQSSHAEIVLDRAETHGVPCQERPEWFYPVGRDEDLHEYVEAAQRLCNTCPVRAACLAWALEDREVHGIWGAVTAKERKRMRGLVT